MRVKKSVASRKRRKRILKLAKGYWGRRKNNLRRAKETLRRAFAFAYRDRKRKREFRKLWVVRINAAVRQFDMSYSKFIAGLKKSGIELDRKSLSELAIRDPEGFKAVVEASKAKYG